MLDDGVLLPDAN